jgi:hypothetical protein
VPLSCCSDELFVSPPMAQVSAAGATSCVVRGSPYLTVTSVLMMMMIAVCRKTWREATGCLGDMREWEYNIKTDLKEMQEV